MVPIGWCHIAVAMDPEELRWQRLARLRLAGAIRVAGSRNRSVRCRLSPLTSCRRGFIQSRDPGDEAVGASRLAGQDRLPGKIFGQTGAGY